MNNIFRVVTIALTLLTFNAYANTPTEDSARQLLKSTGSEKAIEQMRQDLTQYLETVVMMMNGQIDQQKANAVVKQLEPILSQELTWAKLEPYMVKAVRNTFTQAEVNAQIEFYNTPIGMAIANKNFAFTVNVVKANQDFQQVLQPKLQAALQQQLQQ